MFKVAELLEATEGKLLQGRLDTVIAGVSTDTRTIRPRQLFIAIKGERFNGHAFIKKAIKKRANAVIIAQKTKTLFPKDFVVISVVDTTQALADVARFHRKRFDIPIITVTGSNGKTTTKEMISHVLAKRYKVLSSEGTQNNHIGVPLTLLKLNRQHQVAVLELGTNHVGEIFNLSKIAIPDIAVFTNIGPSHLEFLKNTDVVFKEKYSLVRNVKADGSIIFNKDDSYLQKIEKDLKIKQKILSFSIKRDSSYQATKINLGFDSLRFLFNNRIWIKLNTPAEHNVYNALAAIACAGIFKIDLKTIKAALEEFKFPKMRFNLNRIRDFYLIDDSYNSNPFSLDNAIRSLSRYACGRKILVCGDMLELGKGSKEFHFNLGKKISEYGIDVLITVGRLSKWLAKGAEYKRKDNNKIWSFNSSAKATSKLLNIIDSGDVILVKGSRLLKMERIVEDIKNNF